MLDLKDQSKIDLIIYDCGEVMKRQTRHARIALRIPGKEGKQTTKRLYPLGPEGKIVGVTRDGNSLIVLFNASEVKTKLEGLRNAIITSRSGSRKIDELNTGLRMGADRHENHRDTGKAHNKKGVGQGGAVCVVSTEPNVLF